MPGSFKLAACLCLSLCFWIAGREVAWPGCLGDDLFAVREKGWNWGEELRRSAASLPHREGRFWKISGGTGAPSYVFGTLHLSDPRLASIPPDVAERIRDASILAVETTEVSSLGAGRLGQQARRELQASIRAPNGRRAGTLLDPSDYEALEQLAEERGLPPAAARFWKAPVLALLLDLPPCATAGKQPYLDSLVVQLARRHGVEIVGLETLAEQFGVFDGLSPESERALLVSVLRQASFGASVVESQIGRFLARDAGGIVALMRIGPNPETPDSRTPPEFLERLLDVRTARMAERLQPYLERGNAVVAIGIAHLPGSDGLIARLQKAGYTVSALD